MTLPPTPQRDDFARTREDARRQREALDSSATRTRKVPQADEIARRRKMLQWTKRLLPGLALLLLASIAAWPEIDRMINSNTQAISQLERLHIESGNMTGAIYRGLDTHQRPYMITADTARQITAERINLVNPVADSIMQGNGWVMIKGDHGVYMQHAQDLDLSGNVTLYRDDGLIMYGPTADIDVRRGIVASDNWVHAEGPFGVLDAQGYIMADHDGIAQFRGPGRLILNDDSGSNKNSVTPAQTKPADVAAPGSNK